jgi:hypothetical protein
VDKKADGPLNTIILVLVFVLMWFLWLGGFVAEMGQNAVEGQGLTGVEAWGYSNVNLFILIGLLLGTMAYFYLSSG